MKKIKVSEATGPALDWLVAKCKGIPVARHSTGAIYLIDTPWADKSRVKWLAEFSPRKHWAQGGPIIDRLFKQGLRLHTAEYMTGVHNKELLVASLDSPNGFWFGPTPLVAAMRCYVASELGDEVEVPDELLESAS